MTTPTDTVRDQADDAWDTWRNVHPTWGDMPVWECPTLDRTLDRLDAAVAWLDAHSRTVCAFVAGLVLGAALAVASPLARFLAL